MRCHVISKGFLAFCVILELSSSHCLGSLTLSTVVFITNGCGRVYFNESKISYRFRKWIWLTHFALSAATWIIAETVNLWLSTRLLYSNQNIELGGLYVFNWSFESKSVGRVKNSSRDNQITILRFIAFDIVRFGGFNFFVGRFTTLTFYVNKLEIRICFGKSSVSWQKFQLSLYQ